MMNNTTTEPQNPVEVETEQEKEYRLAIEEGREPPEFNLAGGYAPIDREHGDEAQKESLKMMEGNHWGFDGYFNNSLAGDM